MIKYMTELQMTGVGIIWIEIPGDTHGNYLCGELKKNLIQTWKMIEHRFIETFLQTNAKIKRIDLYDPQSDSEPPLSSLIRLEIESNDSSALIERLAVPIRWMPFQNSPKVEKALVNSLTRSGFLDGECLAGFERRICNESRRWLLREAPTHWEGSAADDVPFLILYVHWNATIGPGRSSSAQFWGGHSKPSGLAVSVRHASMSWCWAPGPIPEKINAHRSRTIRCKSEPTCSHDYKITKPTKSAVGGSGVIQHNPLYKNEKLDQAPVNDDNDGAYQQ